jgi:hypothetical protein
MKRAEKLVEDFWKGVPMFDQWCKVRQARARELFIAETATGRVIDFQSAMQLEHIHVPTKQEKALLSKYYDYNRAAKEAKEAGDEDRYESYKNAKDRLWKNPETGVRNAIEYNQFIGKMQRVAVNTPVQGLCGDFMRIAINRIKKWVENDPDIQSVFRFHGSVHDEIDVSIKNEYIPFILPRLTRLMKLRKYHEQMQWTVPIECDAEYGRSWDIDWNVTKIAYTKIDELATYVPDVFNTTTVNNLYKSIMSGDEGKRARAQGYLEQSLHPRAYKLAKKIFEMTDKKAIQQTLIASLQLHEYWTIDHVPDGDDSTLETLAQYEARTGVSARDKQCPEFGYMGSISLDNPNVIRPGKNLLDDPNALPTPEVTIDETVEPEQQAQLELDDAEGTSPEFLSHKVGA